MAMQATKYLMYFLKDGARVCIEKRQDLVVAHDPIGLNF